MKSETANILLFGDSGRMGVEIQQEASHGTQAAQIVATQSRSGELLSRLPGIEPNVIVDFSTAQGTAAAVETARRMQIPILVGTTALPADTLASLAALSKVVPVLVAANTSLGVNVLLDLIRRAQSALGPDFDIEIVETHHRRKHDSPSGTAQVLYQALRSPDSKVSSGAEYKSVHGRFGPETLRGSTEIGVHAVRGGSVAGEHSVIFFGEGERIEITHRAQSRSIFAKGAVVAAVYLARYQAAGRPPALLSMADVLSLKDQPQG